MTLNNRELTMAEVMTIRVALCSFMGQLERDKRDLDELGTTGIDDSYLKNAIKLVNEMVSGL